MCLNLRMTNWIMLRAHYSSSLHARREWTHLGYSDWTPTSATPASSLHADSLLLSRLPLFIDGIDCVETGLRSWNDNCDRSLGVGCGVANKKKKNSLPGSTKCLHNRYIAPTRKFYIYQICKLIKLIYHARGSVNKIIRGNSGLLAWTSFPLGSLFIFSGNVRSSPQLFDPPEGQK